MYDVLTEKVPGGSSKTEEWLNNGQFTASQSPTPEQPSSDFNTFLMNKQGMRDIKTNMELHRRRRHRQRHASPIHKTKTLGNFSTMGRFTRTAIALRQSGLLQITQSISQLIKSNDVIQKEMDRLQKETIEYSRRLQRELQKKLEAENEKSGSCNHEGQLLLSKLSQSLLNTEREFDYYN